MLLEDVLINRVLVWKTDMKFYTDYPIRRFGDTEKSQIIREVDIVSYDRDKYVTVIFKDDVSKIEEYIKSGYIYTKPQIYNGKNQVKLIDLFKFSLH